MADAELVTSVDGCRVAAFCSGNPRGQAIVFLHGFALDHTVWDAQVASPLVASHRLITMDLRGHGASDKPSEPSAYDDGRRWAGDLASVLAHYGVTRPVVVAWSFGGRVLNDFLRHFGQDSVAGINYVAAATLSDPATVGPAHTSLGDLCASEPDVEARGRRSFADDVLGAPVWVERLTATTPELRRLMRRRGLDYDALLAELTVPVLLTHGSADPLVLPLLTERLAALLPHAEVAMYEGAGHLPFRDDAARFNADLARFALACGERSAR